METPLELLKCATNELKVGGRLENPLVSVIIPVYNCEQFLPQCIESIMRQTYQMLEIILVNDGSKDDSGAICDAYAKNDERIVVVHKENQGAAAARKMGIELAKGRYSCFVDSDDWLEADYIESLLVCTQENDSDVVIGLMRGRNEDGNTTQSQHYFSCGHYDRERLRWEVWPQMLSASPYYTFGIAPSMWGKLYKTELAHRNAAALDTGITFGEDGCFTYSALLDAENVFISDVKGYNYRTNMASVTHRFDEKLWQDGPKLTAFYVDLKQRKQWKSGAQIEEYTAFVCECITNMAIRAGYATNAQGRSKLKECTSAALTWDVFRHCICSTAGLKRKVKFILMKCNAWKLLDVLKTKVNHEENY